MPKVSVDIISGVRTSEQKRELLDIIHESLVQAIKIPPADRFQILHEHDRENFYIPFSLSDWYVNIDIVMYPGRADEAKKELARLIKEKLSNEGYNPEEIMLTLHEPPLSNWG